MQSNSLFQSLQRIQRKLRTLEVLHGLGLMMLWMVGLLLGAMGLDYLLHLPAVPRLLVLMGLVAVGGYLLFRRVLLPVARPLSLGDVAGKLEKAFPEFEDRLRSAVDFADEDLSSSVSMQQMVLQQATDMARRVNLDSALVRKPVFMSLGGGAGAVLLSILLMMALGHSIRSIALSRLLNPFSNANWPRSVQISLEGAAPVRVPVGQRIPVAIRLTRGDKPSMRPVIYYQYDKGAVQKELMTRNSDGIFTAALDARLDAATGNGKMNVWMEAGDDQFRLAPIEVVPRLAIKAVTLSVTPPSYANQPPTTLDLSTGPATVTFGSQAVLSVQFNKALNADHPLSLSGAEDSIQPTIPWVLDGNDRVTGTFRVEKSFRFHIRGTDHDGFQNPALEEYELIMRPDQMPMVQIENPRRNEDRTAEATVPLQGVMEDDFGIPTVQLLVTKLGGDKKSWTIDLVKAGKPVQGVTYAPVEGTPDRRRYRLNWSWELARSLDRANLTGGDVLEYALQVQDNFLLDGQRHSPVLSGRLRISIVTQEQFTQRLIEQLRAVAQQVRDTRSMQERTRAETQGLKQDTQTKKQFDQADQAAADRIGAQQSTTASQTRQLSGKLGEVQKQIEENRSTANDLKQTVTDVKDLLEKAAENPMKDAATDISDARAQVADPKATDAQQKAQTDARNKAMDHAISSQQEAIKQLDQSLEKMGNVGTLAQSIEHIRQLLEQQKNVSAETDKLTGSMLGRRPEELTPQQREDLKKNADKQQKLADATQAALDEMNKSAESMQPTDPASAETLRKAAQTGTQQQVSSNQSQAARSTSENQQSQARSAQDSAELGLQMMLTELRDAEKRRMEQLSRKLEELQGLIQDLVRRQAGHNLDNLAIQGADAIKARDAKELDQWIAMAGRDKNHLPPAPQLQQLSAGQEQTERNTRDIAQTAEKAEQGEAIAATLTRAAGRMERAAVQLRDNKLTDALTPPQEEALAALTDALNQVIEMKKKIDDKQSQQKKDALRDRYVKLRQDQASLNAETLRLEKSRAASDGKLARKDAIRLGQMPGDQGKLSDTVAKLDVDLQTLGSVVYVWANQDIRTSMDFVKDRLGQKETGKAVQSEQQRVLDMLDLMIRNLAQSPSDNPEFANKQGGGGGGGGGGSPKATLPTEAELKLLRDLQQSVNAQTRQLNDDPNRNPADLEQLSTRQDQLRKVLDKLLQQASRGQVRLGPEPDNRDMLPEEAPEEKIEEQELVSDLLNDDPADEKLDKDVNLVGDRMARSRQRLGLAHDPGKVTQKIQERILLDLDKLIQTARQQSQQSSSSSQSKPGQAMDRPKDGQAQQPSNDGQSQANAQSTPAGQSTAPNGGNSAPDLPPSEIQEKMAEWGGLSARDRQAVIDARSETIIEKYRRLTDDYYRSLATKATEHK